MFAVLSSSDVWPKVIHIKHLACVFSLSLAQTLAHSLFSIVLSPSWAAQADTLFSLTPSFHYPWAVSPPRSLSYPSPVISLCLLSVTVTSNPLFYFLYVLPFLDLRAWRWLDLIMLGDPHLISHVREILKQVNLPVLRGKDTPLHFLPSWIRCDISWAGIKVE